jgi:hypothetical protein
MTQYDFSTQKELFNISCQILSDYEIKDWSFGGGTALSILFYQHRMSYDIDIFSEDFSAIQRLIENKEEIAKNLGIDMIEVRSSNTGVTFGLDDGGLKLDFVYSPALSSEPYVIKDVFGYTNIKVQTPLEIIAKKLKHREKATIRDFVDYAIVEERAQLLTKLKSEGIVDIERYFDVIEKFNNFDSSLFNEELENLLPKQNLIKEDFSNTINNLMKPRELIRVALDNTNEVVSFDEFIEPYRNIYEELGKYSIYTIKNNGISYKDVLGMKLEEILELSKNIKDKEMFISSLKQQE